MSYLDQITKMEEQSESIFENVTREDLKTAAEMFIYLNTCPHTESLKVWFKGRYKFLCELFQTKPPKQIILTLNRMMKWDPTKNTDAVAEKLFIKIAELLSLQFEGLQSILPGGNIESGGGNNYVSKSEGKACKLRN